MFGIENKGHELKKKNGLPCLLDILPVFVCRILTISARLSGFKMFVCRILAISARFSGF